MERNRQWLFTGSPRDTLDISQFASQVVPVPEPGESEVLVRHRYLSLMPGNRVWMVAASVREGAGSRTLVPGFAVGEVVASRHPAWQVGDAVETMLGWQDYAVARPEKLTRRSRQVLDAELVGLLGPSSVTGYFGLLDVGRPRAGETLLVSAASGGVGSMVVQLGKLAGCRVVGVAGGSAKCRWLVEELGADAAVDYKADGFEAQLRQACPEGVNLYFDNTAGPVLEAALKVLVPHGRIVCCGATAQYNADGAASCPSGIPLTVIMKSLTMQGFEFSSFRPRFDEADRQLSAWYEAGRIRSVSHLIDGFDHAPQGLVDVFKGGNRGATFVRL